MLLPLGMGAALATAAMGELAVATVRAALPMMPAGETMANAAKATTAWATAVVTAHRTARTITSAKRTRLFERNPKLHSANERHSTPSRRAGLTKVNARKITAPTPSPR